jgi:hypothetical protein
VPIFAAPQFETNEWIKHQSVEIGTILGPDGNPGTSIEIKDVGTTRYLETLYILIMSVSHQSIDLLPFWKGPIPDFVLDFLVDPLP